jgi:hydrogenase expression/formation protein HypC
MCLGIPGKIVEITDRDKKLAKVDIAGVQREVNIVCIVTDDHPLDSCLLVHVGCAMTRINEEEAMQTLALLAELGEAQQELEAMRSSQTHGAVQ